MICGPRQPVKRDSRLSLHRHPLLSCCLNQLLQSVMANALGDYHPLDWPGLRAQSLKHGVNAIDMRHR
jgi:hypothetical protein